MSKGQKEKIKQVNNMEQTKLENKIELVQSRLEGHDIGAMLPVLEANFTAALNATTDEDRDKMWSAIRSLCGTLTDANGDKLTVIANGRQVEPALAIVFESMINTLNNLATTLYADPLIQAIAMPSSRSGGTYDEASFVESFTESYMNKCKRAINEKRWNGKLNEAGLPEITPFPIKEGA